MACYTKVEDYNSHKLVSYLIPKGLVNPAEALTVNVPCFLNDINPIKVLDTNSYKMLEKIILGSLILEYISLLEYINPL